MLFNIWMSVNFNSSEVLFWHFDRLWLNFLRRLDFFTDIDGIPFETVSLMIKIMSVW